MRVELTDEQKHRLATVRDFIEEHPDRYNQQTYGVNRIRPAITDHDKKLEVSGGVARATCGTTACVAGWTSLIFGESAHWKPVMAWDFEGNRAVEVGWMSQLDAQETQSDASELLGITDDPDFLFGGHLTWDEVRDRIAALLEGRVERHDESYSHYFTIVEPEPSSD